MQCKRTILNSVPSVGLLNYCPSVRFLSLFFNCFQALSRSHPGRGKIWKSSGWVRSRSQTAPCHLVMAHLFTLSHVNQQKKKKKEIETSDCKQTVNRRPLGLLLCLLSLFSCWMLCTGSVVENLKGAVLSLKMTLLWWNMDNGYSATDCYMFRNHCKFISGLFVGFNIYASKIKVKKNNNNNKIKSTYVLICTCSYILQHSVTYTGMYHLQYIFYLVGLNIRI